MRLEGLVWFWPGEWFAVTTTNIISSNTNITITTEDDNEAVEIRICSVLSTINLANLEILQKEKYVGLKTYIRHSKIC